MFGAALVEVWIERKTRVAGRACGKRPSQCYVPLLRLALDDFGVNSAAAATLGDIFPLFKLFDDDRDEVSPAPGVNEGESTLRRLLKLPIHSCERRWSEVGSERGHACLQPRTYCYDLLTDHG